MADAIAICPVGIDHGPAASAGGDPILSQGPSRPLERLIGILRTNTELPFRASKPDSGSRTLAGNLMSGAASSTANTAAMAVLGEGPVARPMIANLFGRSRS